MAINRNIVLNNDLGSYNWQTMKRLYINSNNRLYTIYEDGSSVIKLAYSDDAGLNWSEISGSPFLGTVMRNPGLWIDSNDDILVNGTNPTATSPKYNKYTGSWGSAENIDSGITTSLAQVCPTSSDQPYCVYRYAPSGSYTRICANKRNGSWGSRSTLLLDVGWTAESIAACIDFDDNIHAIWQLKNGNDYKIQAAYWDGSSWSSISTIDTYDDAGGRPVIRLVGSTLVAVWSRNGLGTYTSNNQVRVSLCTSLGTWGTSSTLTDRAGNSAGYDVCGGYGSNIIVVYDQVGADLNNPSILNLAYKYYDGIWSDETLLTEENVHQRNPSIINNGTIVHIIWHEPDNSDIYHGSFDSTPTFPKEIYDYVDTIAADVDVTLSLDPQVVISEVGGKGDVVHLADDESEERIGYSSDFKFYIIIRFDLLNESDAGTLLDIWADSSKANGRVNSWKFVHPDGHTYVVRFDTDITRLMSPTYYTIKNIRLKVLGRIAD